jgi:hypothetical protein
MNGDYDPLEMDAGAPRRSVLRRLIAPGLAFLLGLGAMGYILSHWDAAARVIGVAPQDPAAPEAALAPQDPTRPLAADPAPAPDDGTAADEPERIVIDPEIGRRVAALEARVGQVDNQSRAAVGNADRAEGLLVAFAARRALDRGVALGFLEALLRQRFGETQPQAVGMIILAARDPVTLQELQGGLQQLGPQLIGAGPSQSWWGAFRGELGSLITVRREGTPSSMPAERLARATRWLESGEVAPALAEIQRMPGAERAAEWVGRARRYVSARRALDAIETAALLEPRAEPQASPAPARAATPPAAAAAAPPRPAARR